MEGIFDDLEKKVYQEDYNKVWKDRENDLFNKVFTPEFASELGEGKTVLVQTSDGIKELKVVENEKEETNI